jgi:5S rRNA maturation endonuclease (ribonuclease M5)
LPKQIKISGKVDKFYGQDDYTSGKNITITEGEEDRLSVIEMMGDWPAVSVPGATPSKDFWENARQYLQNFEKIVLSVDSDEPGDKLADKFYRMFPGKVYRVNHGKYKDANDFLKAGAEAEYKRLGGMPTRSSQITLFLQQTSGKKSFSKKLLISTFQHLWKLLTRRLKVLSKGVLQ